MILDNLFSFEQMLPDRSVQNLGEVHGQVHIRE